MKRVTKQYFRKNENGFAIWCPACKCGHQFDRRWKLDEEKKTVTPSMNVNNDECHFSITCGKIIFHTSRHNLSGETVNMVKF